MRIASALWPLILVSVLAGAQQSRNVQGATSPNGSAGPITVRGCLSGGREAYTLMQSGTGTAFKLQGDVSELENARGKMVEVKGREFPPATNKSANDMSRLPTLAVTAVRLMGGECGLQAGGKGATATPTEIPQNPPPQNPPATAQTPKYASPGAPNQTPPPAGDNPNAQGANGAPGPGTGNPPPPSPPPAP